MKTCVLYTPRTVHRPIRFPAADPLPSIPKGVALPVFAECATPFTFSWPGHATLVFYGTVVLPDHPQDEPDQGMEKPRTAQPRGTHERVYER